MKTTATSGVAQVLKGTAFAGLCAFAIKTDITNNLHYFGPINAEFAGITVAAAICIAVLPWRRWGALKGVCLALTCWAAAAAYANSLGLDIAKNADAGKSHALAVADATAARATLARIAETADTATLTQMAEAAKAKANAADQKANEQLGDNAGTACLKVKACRDAGVDHQTLLGRLSQAKARDTAQAMIAKADAKAEMVGTAKIDVLAIKIASIAGSDDIAVAQNIAIVLAILAIGATQGLALLGHSALTLIGDGIATIASAPAIERPIKAAKKTVSKKLNKADALKLLHAHIEQRGGEMLASSQQIAKLFPGVHRNTICGAKGWLAQWRRDGEIECYDHDTGATVWRARKAA